MNNESKALVQVSASRAMSTIRVMRTGLALLAGGLLAGLLTACGAGKSTPSGEWALKGQNGYEQYFSPLKEVNADNVARLGLAWHADLDTARGQEATPLMVDGVLYVSTAWSMVKAFDATNGKLLWSYDPKVPREVLAKVCCDAVNRGVAVAGGRVFVGTLDGRLVALDAKTGKEAWSEVTVDQSGYYTITGAVRVAKDMVLIGNSGAEYGVRGYLSAYDQATGKMRWRFYTVPRPDGKPDGAASDPVMAKARATWSDGGDWVKSGGGGTVWDAIVYDEAQNLVIFGVGNGNPWNYLLRSEGKGDNLFLSSVVAVNADTGAYAWHFQETPGETWDFTATQPITLADLTIDGKPRKVLLHAPKNGFFYVIDRTNGEFISGDKFVDHMNWATGVDPKTGRPIENPAARYYNSDVPFFSMPGAVGAHSWQPQSFSPETGLIYIPVNDAGFPYAAVAPKDWEAKPRGMNVGVDMAKTAMPPIKEVRAGAMANTKGYLLAWDPVNRKEVWRAQHAGPSNGGTLATAGNLVFQGTAAGKFKAFRATDGKEVWAQDAQTGVLAAPMSYAINGKQYVAVLAGWGGVWAVAPGILSYTSGPVKNVSRLLVYALDGKDALPAVVAEKALPLDPPPLTADKATVAQGAGLYSRYCNACHGDAAISGGINPDLRHSATLASAEAWKTIVFDGALREKGMVSFANVADAKGVDSIRHYVIARAHEDLALEQAK
jgi:alcohol dehydrogenase (cytochrome c)/quinohemoprotein ethanol dehydrogenase